MCASDRRVSPGLRWPRLWLAAAVSMAALGAQAQSADRAQEQVKRLRQQVRELQQEQASLREAQTRAAQDKASAESALKAAQGEAKSGQQAAGAASRRASALNTELSGLKEKNGELEEQVQRLTAQLAGVRNEQAEAQATATKTVADWQGRHQKTEGRLAQCRQHNAELATLGEDLLGRYERKTVAEVLAVQEPFFQTSRVRLENLKADYQDKIDAQRVKP